MEQFASKARFSPKRKQAEAVTFEKGPVVWTRKERYLVAFMALIVMIVALGVVATSMQTQSSLAKSRQIQEEIKEVKEKNDLERNHIQQETNTSRLKIIAQQAGMDQDFNRTKNIR